MKTHAPIHTSEVLRKDLAVFRLVRPPGIEPGYAASETTILSVELRALCSEAMLRMSGVRRQVVFSGMSRC
jgi:hypothetical protein